MIRRAGLAVVAAACAGCVDRPESVSAGTGGMETENTIAILETAEGAPAAGARVAVLRATDGEARAASDSFTVVADDSGRVRVSQGLTPGVYGLSIDGAASQSRVVQLGLPLDSMARERHRLGFEALLRGTSLPAGARLHIPGTLFSSRVGPDRSWSLRVPPGDFIARANDSAGGFLGETLVRLASGDSVVVEDFGDTTFAREHYQSWARRRVYWMPELQDSTMLDRDRLFTMQLAGVMTLSAGNRRSFRAETGGDRIRLRHAILAWDSARKVATVQVRVPYANKSKGIRIYWGLSWARDRSCLPCLLDSSTRKVVKLN